VFIHTTFFKMIPKSLLLTFLSLRIPEQSPSTASDVQVFDYTVPQYDVNVAAQSPIIISAHEDPEVRTKPKRKGFHHDVSVTGGTVLDFDALPSGDWDDSRVINDTVKLSSDGDSRIWSLKDAFPKLKPRYGGNHVFGSFPAGSKIVIKFVDGPHSDLLWSIGWVVNGQLSYGNWRARVTNGGVYVYTFADSFGAGSWKTMTTGGALGDEITITVDDAVPTGVLLIEYLSYAD
jgi:hypothetical protein